MKRLFILVFSLAAVSALPYTRDLQRIVGGELTNISQYPFGTALLFGQGTFFNQACGGSIINYRTILSAAHCFNANYTPFWRARVGSANAHSGGVVHEIKLIINHPAYNRANLDNDISLLRITAAFAFNNNVNVGSIAGPNYNVPDNAAVWAIGWGRISVGGPQSEQLRHVQVWVVNLAICRSHYAEIGHDVTDSMLCSGWLDVGGRDQCQGDSGGPLLHNNVIVGVSSWGEGCAHPRFPGVNARVSSHTSWIQNNA